MACHDARRSNPLDPESRPAVAVSVSQDAARREAIVEWTPYSGATPFEEYVVLRSSARFLDEHGDTLFTTPDFLFVSSKTRKVDTLAVISDQHQTSFVDRSLAANISYVYRVSVHTVGGLKVASHDSAPVRGPSMQQIAFYSDRAGNWEVFVMNADGSGVINLTDHPGDDGPASTEVGRPAWSPDGDRIAFVSKRDFNDEIYVMDADGGNQINITNHPSNDIEPSWSPDGLQIVFASRRDDDRFEIYTMDSDGSNVVRLTDNPGEWDIGPMWSPDGTRIAFWSVRNGKDVGDLFVMNTDGSGLTQVTDTDTYDFDPDWSPDGTRIAYLGNGQTGDEDVFVIDSDGRNKHQINTGGRWPDWSPDGTMLAYSRRADGAWEIYVSNADGTGEVNITNHDADDKWCDWRPVVK